MDTFSISPCIVKLPYNSRYALFFQEHDISSSSLFSSEGDETLSTEEASSEQRQDISDGVMLKLKSMLQILEQNIDILV